MAYYFHSKFKNKKQKLLGYHYFIVIGRALCKLLELCWENFLLGLWTVDRGAKFVIKNNM
jgi:hypothetical protein